MSSNLSPSQRSLRARIANAARLAQYDARDLTRDATAASPARLSYWTRRVDPNLELDEVERERRAQSAKRAHFLTLAAKSADARRRRSSA